MAKIVKSEMGYWVGKELYPYEQYISFNETCITCPIEKLKIVSFEQLQKDIKKILHIKVSKETPIVVMDMITMELSNSRYGLQYIYDHKCIWKVRKAML
jgi:hypothetical protein